MKKKERENPTLAFMLIYLLIVETILEEIVQNKITTTFLKEVLDWIMYVKLGEFEVWGGNYKDSIYEVNNF